ncbi:alanine racemase [Parvularcula sp. IMCC14364]|uniref:alanine racemase n=1 Tax=Parvularcula sp. IMCC14364 TaxID=3067902 RepID=UPI002742712B|nr:alanine racemase [Parvularcula sp. IMCC14364]
MSNDRPRLTVDLAALKHNYATLKSRRPDADLAAVVKANAYGLGMALVARALAEAGCQTFFVAYAFEGMALRDILGKQPDICVLNGPGTDNLNEFMAANLTPVLNTPEQVRLWSQNSDRLAMLHVDTGMNRLGLSIPEALATAASAADLTVSHILSHFACSDDPLSEENQSQITKFTDVTNQLGDVFPGARHSISASGGLFLPDMIEEDLTRPGLALYGICPQASLAHNLKTVARLEAPVLQTRKLEAGDAVGYGSTYRTNNDMQIATIAIGYGDGYPRALSGKGHVMIGGHACPILGIISMDLVSVDISTCTTEVSPGRMAECFGDQLPVQEIAKVAGTIPYELFVTLGERVMRCYTD